MEFYFIVLTLQLLLLTTCQGDLPSCGTSVSITPGQIVKLRSNITFECQHKTNPNTSFLWNYITNEPTPRKLIVSPTEHIKFPERNRQRLLIINATSDLVGKYFCEKLNPPGCISNASSLTIFRQATIVIMPKKNIGHTGGSINLTVVLTGNPLPTTIMLQKWDGRHFAIHSNTKYSITNLHTVSFHDLSPQDSGRYRVCVENSPDGNSIECDTFEITITGPPIIEPIPPMTVKNGGNLSVVCRVVHSIGNNYQMTWLTADGNDLVNDPSSQITQINASELRLVVKKVTKAAAYLCVVKNTSGIILNTEHVSVYLTDVPGPPRNLNIQSIGSSGVVSITWTAPETDNRSPITAYYVTVIVDGVPSSITQISPNATKFEVFTKCRMINVAVTSENDCGNSSVVDSIIDTRNKCAVSSVAENSESNDDDTLPIVGATIGVISFFVMLIILVIAVFVIWWKKQKRELKQLPSAYNVEALPNVKVNSLKMIVTTTPPPLIRRTSSIRQYRSMLEVPRDSVMLRDVLCDSTYYELRKGLITIPDNENRTHEVMVKKAKESAPSEEEHNIQEEIKMMSSIGNHENVVGLLRTCLLRSPVYLITEYFTHGDLLGFLRASRGHYGMYTISPGTGCKTHPCAVQAQDLLKIATQVAAGMNYLSEKKIIHRSLCARNVLVGTGLQVKVYNYGPKADTEAIPHNYTKWMAPEMLFDGTADTMSDVWSFGVTFWEIVTIGGSPYPHTHPGQIRELLQTGHRLPKPDHCAEALYTIMDQCWKMDPRTRPTFSVLHKQLDDMCKSKLSFLDSSLYNDEEYTQFEETHQLMTAL